MLGDYLDSERENIEAFTDTYQLKRWVEDQVRDDESEESSSIVAVVFDKEGDSLEFNDVIRMDLKGNEIDVLYKKGTSRGGDWGPSTKITQNTKSHYEGRPNRLFGYGFCDDRDEFDLIANTREEYLDNEEEIKGHVAEKRNVLDKGPNHVLSVVYRENGELKFPVEIGQLKKALKKNVKESWHYTTTHGESSSEDELCAVCRERKKVYGYSFPFKFYTIDNARYAPSFERSDSWKNLPVCENCSERIAMGSLFVKEQDFSYYVGDNVQYYVIPEFLGEVSDNFLDLVGQDTESTEGSLLEAERFYRNVDDLEAPVNLEFIFFKTKQNSEKIKKEIKDVAPSHISDLEDSIDRLSDEFNPHFKGDYTVPRELDSLILNVLPRPNPEKNEPKDFFNKAMDLTSKILKGDKVKREDLVSIFVDEGMSRFRNPDEKNYPHYMIKSFFFLEFLRKNDLLDENSTMKDFNQIMEDLETEEDENIKKFFDEHSNSFDSPAKKAAFLEGVLAQNLMQVQWRQRYSDSDDSGTKKAPFRKKLANLRLDKEKLEYIFTEASRTLEIYDSKTEKNVSYTGLRETVAHYLLLAEEDSWQISDDDISYFFTLGMSLNQVFKNNSTEGDN